MTVPIEEYDPNEPYVSARDLNAIMRELTRFREMSGDGCQVVADAGGFTVSVPPAKDVRWAKLTGESAGAYSWVEVERTAAGTFTTVTGGLSGTTTLSPAREINGTTGIAADTYVQIERGWAAASGTDVDQEWVFNGGVAASSSSFVGAKATLAGDVTIAAYTGVTFEYKVLSFSSANTGGFTNGGVDFSTVTGQIALTGGHVLGANIWWTGDLLGSRSISVYQVDPLGVADICVANFIMPPPANTNKYQTFHYQGYGSYSYYFKFGHSSANPQTIKASYGYAAPFPTAVYGSNIWAYQL